MPISIKIENLSKQYRLGVIGTGTLSHDLKRWWTTSIRGKEDPYLKIGETNHLATRNSNRAAGELMSEANKPETLNPKSETRNSKLEIRNSKPSTLNSQPDSQYIWALKDINLEIEQGDVVGIIGKNGAGKSTLLKILSRVTKPTTGSIQYNGRIASLLEVGTGFHPEMTGRENIYMNGAIMGMTRHEITSKLDEIIVFAGVERYIDTPVKRYSSGMTVRLGFSIAAHLEPDILVVDEVLAVGDAEFQKKAIGKMQDVSKGSGRTVLFVSHNMAAVKNLCTRAILLQNGFIVNQGDVNSVVDTYVDSVEEIIKTEFQNNITNNNNIYIKSFKITTVAETGKAFGFEANIYSENEVYTAFAVGIRLKDSSPIMHIYSGHVGENFKLKKGENLLTGKLDSLFLGSGIYDLNLWLGFGAVVYDFHKQALTIAVKEGAIRKNGPISSKNGYPVITNAKWEII
jgi:lipopolysaccharide transport system ATP-binding protein